jgi:hypothetical protein
LRARQAPNSDLVIAGGDFNAGAYYPADTWQCPGGRLQAGHWRNATAWALIQHYGQLRDGVSASGLPDTAHTATDANSLYRHSYEGTEYPIRMDHLFIRDAWNQVRASHAERLFTDVLDFGTAGRFELSDHYGMALTLEGLQPRESAT